MEKAKNWIADKAGKFWKWITGDDLDVLEDWKEWEIQFEKIIVHPDYKPNAGVNLQSQNITTQLFSHLLLCALVVVEIGSHPMKLVPIQSPIFLIDVWKIEWESFLFLCVSTLP